MKHLRPIKDPRQPTWLAMVKSQALAAKGEFIHAGVVEDDGTLLELRIDEAGIPEVRANAWNSYVDPAMRAGRWAEWLAAATGFRWVVVRSEVLSWKVSITFRLTRVPVTTPLPLEPPDATPVDPEQGDAFEAPA